MADVVIAFNKKVVGAHIQSNGSINAITGKMRWSVMLEENSKSNLNYAEMLVVEVQIAINIVWNMIMKEKIGFIIIAV